MPFETSKRTSELELYDSGRYLTFTGNRLDGSPTRVRARAEELEAVHGEYVASVDEGSDIPCSTATQTPGVDVTLGDRELLEKARNAANGEKFSRLYDRGDTSRYESHSEARMALLNMLAFWTGKDATQIDRLFRDSALHPHPEKPGTWERLGQDEVQKAIRNCTDTYSGCHPSTSAGETDGGTAETASLPEKADPETAMKDVRGTDTFTERWNRVTRSSWAGSGTFMRLLNGEYEVAGYLHADGHVDRSAAELALARYVGFWFDRNEQIARYVFEEKADLEKYYVNPTHRRDMYPLCEALIGPLRTA